MCFKKGGHGCKLAVPEKEIQCFYSSSPSHNFCYSVTAPGYTGYQSRAFCVVVCSRVSSKISFIEGKASCSVYFHPHQRSLGDTFGRQRPTKGDFSDK